MMFRQVLFYDFDTMLLSSLFSINVTTRSPQLVVYFRLFLKLIFLCVFEREKGLSLRPRFQSLLVSKYWQIGSCFEYC